MTEKQFRELALSLPESIEAEHHSHPDFRVGGRIFASLSDVRGARIGMVKLNLDQQRAFVRDDPASFRAVPGGWGARGATYVPLSKARVTSVRRALIEAWRNTAPRKVVDRFDEGLP